MTCYLNGSTYTDFVDPKVLEDAKRHYSFALKNGYQLNEEPTDEEILEYYKKSL
jgi:hypothetical protein